MGLLINENEFTSKSTSPKLIGETFTTLRTGIIDGAVECDGSQYNFSDFDSNLQSLFDDGKLPYLPIGKFDEMVTNQGGCDVFGYGTTDDLVLYAVYIELAIGEEIQFYTNVLNWHEAQKDIHGVLQGVKLYDKNTYQELVGWYVKYESIVGLYYIYNSEDEEQNIDGYFPGREDTVTIDGEFHPTSYFKVPKKLSRVLVRTQKPTADNNYTWYNVYADGWVEQGGKGSTSASTAITFLIPMATSHYALSFGGNGASTNRNCFLLAGYNRTSTGFTLHAVVVNANSQTSGTSTDSSTWICAGYADPTEYTKDKWNYQNVNYERHMIQLK